MTYINSVLTSEGTRHFTTVEINQLMPFKETMAVQCENCTKHINTQCVRKAEFCMFEQLVHIVTTGLQRVNLLCYS
jgi:hypothetical protein